MQSWQMVEVNLNTVEYGSKHLQHHPAHEPIQEWIVVGEMYRRTVERKGLRSITGDNEERGTMCTRIMIYVIIDR